MLPLDEDHFTINANTRAITIPDSFKKNGLAVQGDHLAEIVYFKIDRYFDYMDFNNTEIFIQWEAPGKDTNGKIIKGVSRAYVRDIESEPGKLIFGWAIEDVITKIAGNLKFSVRFFEWNNADKAQAGTDTSLGYSFSTLVATISIQKSIDLDVTAIDQYKVYDAGTTIADRIEDSIVTGSYQAKAPEFIVDMDDNEGAVIKTRTNEDNTVETYAEFDLDADTLMRILHVHAFASDTGSITYSWKKQGLNENNTTEGEPIETTPYNEMIAVTSDRATSQIVLDDGEDLYDTSANDFKAYNWNLYIKSSDDKNPIYTLYEGNLPPQEGVDSLGADKMLYERQSSFKVTGPGLYYVVASNRVTNSSKSVSGMKAYFLRPEDVIIETQPQATGNILIDSDNNGYLNCNLSVVAKEQDHNVKSYTWYYSNTEAHVDDPDTLTYNKATENELDFGESGDKATVSVRAPGYYKVEVRNDRNNDPEGKVLMSNAARVTEIAETPAFEMNATRFSEGSLSTNAPKIIIDNSKKSDKYEVTWFHYIEGGNNKNEIRQEIAKDTLIGVYEATFNPLKYADDIKPVSGGDIDGFYYAVVTNHWNGSTAASATDENPVQIEDMFVIV